MTFDEHQNCRHVALHDMMHNFALDEEFGCHTTPHSCKQRAINTCVTVSLQSLKTKSDILAYAEFCLKLCN